MWGLMWGAFLAGLVGSPHCVGMCGGFASACAQPASGAAGYHLGRLTTYATLGAVAGALGSRIPGPGWVLTVVAGTLTTVFALSLAGLLPPLAPVLPGVNQLASSALRRGGLGGRFLFGAATALLPCGLVYAALGVPVALAHPGAGAVAMALFGLGTAPLLATASIGLRRVVATSLWARRGLAVLVLAAGWWSIGVRQGLVARAADHGPHADAAQAVDAPPACH